MDENQLLRWLRRRIARRGGDRIGDDAAILPRSDTLAVTMDCQIEGVHFLPGFDPRCLARRVLAVNLSDLAAMGADPAFAFLALIATEGFDHKRFFNALLEASRRHGLELAGGDLARGAQLTAVLTLIGHKPRARRWVRRSSARPGHGLWLGGTVGEAALGLELIRRGARPKGRSISLPEGFEPSARVAAAARRAVRRQILPRPQLELGRWLGGLRSAAAIDLSDGLARDLDRLCSESKVGAEIDARRLPLAKDFQSLARALGSDARRLALTGGEDYVLLFTLAPETEPPRRFGCVRIGRTIDGEGCFLVEGGKRERLPPAGWDHLEG